MCSSDLLTAPARAAIAWIARHHGLDHRPLSILTNALFREVNRYFTDLEARTAARTGVAERPSNALSQASSSHTPSAPS